MRAEGGCHCGAVRFSIRIAAPLELLECNCSICAMTGYRHLIVAAEDFALVRGKEALTSYRFGTGIAEHLFCGTCGIKSFYRPRSHPGGWSVNFTCLDDAATIAAETNAFDGKDWENARRGLSIKGSELL